MAKKTQLLVSDFQIKVHLSWEGRRIWWQGVLYIPHRDLPQRLPSEGGVRNMVRHGQLHREPDGQTRPGLLRCCLQGKREEIWQSCCCEANQSWRRWPGYVCVQLFQKELPLCKKRATSIKDTEVQYPLLTWYSCHWQAPWHWEKSRTSRDCLITQTWCSTRATTSTMMPSGCSWNIVIWGTSVTITRSIILRYLWLIKFTSCTRYLGHTSWTPMWRQIFLWWFLSFYLLSKINTQNDSVSLFVADFLVNFCWL